MRGLLLAAALAGGCALGPGEPMGTLTSTLSARYAAEAGRETQDGFHRLASSYQVRVTRAELVPGPVALIERRAPEGAFDPASPPPGYGLCHNGHCHANDGRLVSYEDIAAELGGGVHARTVVLLHGPKQVDLLAGVARAPLRCEPDCALTAAHVRRIEVPVQRLRIEGQVRDRRSEPSPDLVDARPFVFDFTVSEGEDAPKLTAEVDLLVDRESPPAIQLEVGMTLGPALFDRVPWSSLAGPSGSILLNAVEGAVGHGKVLEALLEQTAVEADVERGFPSSSQSNQRNLKEES